MARVPVSRKRLKTHFNKVAKRDMKIHIHRKKLSTICDKLISLSLPYVIFISLLQWVVTPVKLNCHCKITPDVKPEIRKSVLPTELVKKSINCTNYSTSLLQI